MWPTLLFSLTIVGISLALLQHQRSHWERMTLRRDGDAPEDTLVQRRHRRRMNTAVLMGVLGVVLMPSAMVRDATQLAYWWYWVGLLLGGLALMVSALGDVVGSQRELRRQRQQLWAERQAWLDEVARQKSPTTGNEQPSGEWPCS